MKMRMVRQGALWLGLAVMPIALWASGTPKVTLLQNVEVRGSVITLRDLLPPPSSAASLYSRASRTIISIAPAPASSRAIFRGEIERALRNEPKLLDQLQIPLRITVRRYGRRLTAAEVANAINAVLGNGNGTGKLESGELTLPAVYVTQDDPGIEIVRIEADPLRQQTRFLVHARRETSLLPFWVVTHASVRGVRSAAAALVTARAIQAGQVVAPEDFVVVNEGAQEDVPPAVSAADFAGLQAKVNLKAGQRVNRSMFEPPVLVEPGVPVRLVVEQSGFRITTSVIPLQRGVLGQRIRVRDPDTHRILAAEVVGLGRLRATW